MIKKIVFMSICFSLPLFGSDFNTDQITMIKTKLKDMVAAEESLRTSLRYVKRDAKERFLAACQDQSAQHVAFLKKIFCDHDWIDINTFGREADMHAWLLVQYADHDLAFQKEVLAKLELLYPAHQTRAAHFAFLHDRIETNEGRSQLYGTQGYVKNKQWVVCTVDDPDNLDARRKKMGMLPMKDYIAEVCEHLYKL